MGISVRDAMPRRVASAAFTVVLLGGGTVSCGTDTRSDSAKATTTPKATKASKEESSSVTAAEAVAKAAENTEDITSLRYRITGTVPEKGRLRVEASMNTAPVAMSMEMTTGGRPEAGRLEIRFVDKALYAGGSAVDSEKLDGKNWFRAEPAMWGALSVDNQSYKVLPRQIEGSPITQSTILTGSKHPRKVGAETIDGTRTTHYRGTVTGEGLRAARDAAVDKASRERQIKSFDQFMGLNLDKTLTMDLWIDENDRAKQFRVRGVTYKARINADGEPLKLVGGDPLDMTVTFLDINQPVTVKAPPVKETADLGALADAQAD